MVRPTRDTRLRTPQQRRPTPIIDNLLAGAGLAYRYRHGIHRAAREIYEHAFPRRRDLAFENAPRRFASSSARTVLTDRSDGVARRLDFTPSAMPSSDPTEHVTRSRFSSRRRAARLPRMIKALSQPYFVNDFKAATCTAYEGLQEFGMFNHISPAMISDMRLRLNSYDPQASGYNGNLIAGGFGSMENRGVFQSYGCKTSFTNNSTVPAVFELYDVVPKRDTTPNMYYEGPSYGGTQLAPILWNGTPLSALVNYYSEVANTAGAVPPAYPPGSGTASVVQDMTAHQLTYRRLGFQPWMSTLFRDYFKIVRKRKLLLQPGQTHVHVVSLRPNFLIDSMRLRNYNNNPNGAPTVAYAGITSWTLFKIHGLKAISSDGAVHTTSQVRVDYDSDRSRVGRMMRRLYTKTDNLGVRATSSNTQHVNPYRDVILTDATISGGTAPITEHHADDPGDDGQQVRTSNINPEVHFLTGPGEAEAVSVGNDDIDETEIQPE